jgi:hypothetical protein
VNDDVFDGSTKKSTDSLTQHRIIRRKNKRPKISVMMIFDPRINALCRYAPIGYCYCRLGFIYFKSMLDRTIRSLPMSLFFGCASVSKFLYSR